MTISMKVSNDSYENFHVYDKDPMQMSLSIMLCYGCRVFFTYENIL